MCSILAAGQDTLSKALLLEYVRGELLGNPDGSCLMLDGPEGMTSLRTMDHRLILQLLKRRDWDRCWLHMRAATQGTLTLRNTHGWISTQGIAVMHNGILRGARAVEFEVDSQLILDWLEQGGEELALQELMGEPYANVFLIDSDSGDYAVSRSLVGTLFTDGNGNFSSRNVGHLREAVSPYYQGLFSSYGVAITEGRGALGDLTENWKGDEDERIRRLERFGA